MFRVAGGGVGAGEAVLEAVRRQAVRHLQWRQQAQAVHGHRAHRPPAAHLHGACLGNGVIYVANWPVMYEFWSKYHLPIGNSNLPKNRSETSYLLNKLHVLFEMPVYDTIARACRGKEGWNGKGKDKEIDLRFGPFLQPVLTDHFVFTVDPFHGRVVKRKG